MVFFIRWMVEGRERERGRARETGAGSPINKKPPPTWAGARHKPSHLGGRATPLKTSHLGGRVARAVESGFGVRVVAPC